MSSDIQHQGAVDGKRKWIFALATITAVLIGVFLLLRAFLPPADFSGPATGTTKFKIADGDSVAIIANNLKSAKVISSVDRFVQLCASDSRCTSLQAGSYRLDTGIPVKVALAQLLDPQTRIAQGVLIREGLRASEIVSILSDQTGINQAKFTSVLTHPSALKLPAWAHSNAEGFLFPATYDFPKNATASQILAIMVDKAKQEYSNIDLLGHARALHVSPQQVLTIASIIQAEAHPRDFQNVARVIFNRLATPMRLQMDSTVAYGLHKKQVILTSGDLATDTAYNTYLHDGLPPGPIGNPGIAAVTAAMRPAAGDWLYFITVNLDTQETKFTKSYSEFLKFKDEFLSYCSSNAGSC